MTLFVYRNISSNSFIFKLLIKIQYKILKLLNESDQNITLNLLRYEVDSTILRSFILNKNILTLINRRCLIR